MHRSPAHLAAALRMELHDMRDERVAQAAATKAARHAEALANARAKDEARNAAKAQASDNDAPERNAHVDPVFRGFLNAISGGVR